MTLRLVYPCCGSAVRLPRIDCLPCQRYTRICPQCHTEWDIIANEFVTVLDAGRIHRVTWDDTKNTSHIRTYGE